MKASDNPLYDYLVRGPKWSWVETVSAGVVIFSVTAGVIIYSGLSGSFPGSWLDVAGTLAVGGILLLLASPPAAAIVTVILSSRAIRGGVYNLLVLTNLTADKIARSHTRAAVRRLKLLRVALIVLCIPLVIGGSYFLQDVGFAGLCIVACAVAVAWGWIMSWTSINAAVWAAHRWPAGNQSLVAVSLMAGSYTMIVLVDVIAVVFFGLTLSVFCLSILLIILPFLIANTVPSATVRLLERAGYMPNVPSLPAE